MFKVQIYLASPDHKNGDPLELIGEGSGDTLEAAEADAAARTPYSLDDLKTFCACFECDEVRS